MTSKGTQQEDQIFKRRLYAQIGVEEYWLFDPKGEWLESPLTGYRLVSDDHVHISNYCSRGLRMRLQVKGTMIAFTSLAMGEQLLVLGELLRSWARAAKVE